MLHEKIKIIRSEQLAASSSKNIGAAEITTLVVTALRTQGERLPRRKAFQAR